MDAQFYRQKPIGNYIVDLFAPKANLVVEVDGSQHKETEHEKQDKLRDGYLTSKGIEVLRSNANEVVREIDSVAQRTYEIVKKRLRNKNPPSPLFKGGVFLGHEYPFCKKRTLGAMIF